MSRSPGERCWECGRPVRPAESECGSCGTVQTALCESCGATFFVYAEACPECAFPHEPPAWRPAVSRRRILTFLLFAIAVVGCVLGFRAWRHDEGREKREAFVRAASAYEQSSWETSRIRFEQYVERWGEEPLALYMLGLALWRQDRTEEARQRVERALELRPGYPEAALFLAERAREAGRAEDALAYARQALAAGPGPTDAGAHLLAGRILSEAPLLSLGGAVDHLAAAVRLGRESPDVLLLLADLARLRGRADPGSVTRGEIERWLDRARGRIESRLDLDPTNSELLFLLARIDFRLAEYGRSPWSTSATNLKLSIRYAIDAPENRAEKELLLGKLMWKQMGETRARQVFDGLVETLPSAPVLVEIADFYLGVGMEAAASEVLARAIARFPADPALRLLDVRRHLARGDLETAAAAVEDARQVMPGQPDLLLLDGLTARWRGDRETARELLGVAAGKAGPGSLADLHLIDFLLAVGSDEEADRRFAAATRESGAGDALPLFREYLAGELAVARREYGRAIEHLDRVAGSLPSDPVAHDLLAQAHARRGEHDLAAMEATEALREVGDSVDLLLARGESHLAGGSPDLAVKDAGRVLEIEPDSEPALLLRARARPATAREDLRRSLSATGPRVRTRIALAAKRRAEGKPGEADELLDAAWRRAETAQARMAVTEATGDYARHLAEFPDDPGVRRARAVRLLDEGRLEEAAEAAREALSRSSGDIPARLVLFETRFDGLGLGDGREEARALLDGLRERAAPRGAIAYAEGKMALAEADLDAALERLGVATAARPDRVRYRYAHGVALLLAGDRAEASLALRGTGPAGAAVLSRAREEHLLALARAALTREPGAVAGRRWLRLALDAIEDPAARVGPALALLASAGEPEARALAALAAAPDPGPDDARAGPLADGLFLAGSERERSGEGGAAESLYRRTLSLRPEHVPATVGLSRVLAARGGAGVEEAVELARSARDLAPGRPDVIEALAEALRTRADVREAAGRTDEADRDREEARRLERTRSSR